MTYQEIKDRLSKCELTLEKLKHGSVNSTDVKQKTKKLQVLRESYLKLLKEAEKTAFINGNPVEYEKEDELKKYKDNSDVKTIKTAQGKDIKENEGIKFSVEETKAIAKKVGEAVAKALRDLGDAVHSMKAKRIEENSFEIEVNYKGQGPNDEFSFYITEDSLHLVDFSFDKELVDVGVKPSGEPIVHVDHLANELVKHFKSMNEDMNEAAYTEPKHFDICPGAETLRNKLIDGGKSPEELSDWTRLHDDLFKLEKAVIKANKADDKHVEAASKLRERIIHISRDLGIEAEDITYLKSHVEKIKDIADGKSLNEAPDGLYYIKVPRTDKAQLNAVQNTIETIYHPVRFTDIVDDDGAGNVIMYFPKEDFDPGMIDDLEGEGVDISSQTNLPRGLSEEDDDYKYDGEHQGSNYKWPMSQATKDRKEADKLNRKDEDVDVGHQDDEPDMLKQYAYDIAHYAAKLYKQLDKYDKMDGEVDFPNWWQSKVILAKDYISKAQHYLEFEEKQPAIDQLALEEEVNERLRFLSPEKQKANDAKFEKRMALLKALEKGVELHKAGKISDEELHNLKLKAGTISADSKFKEEELDEAMSSEQKEAIYDLENILDQAAQLGDEARQIVKNYFPNELSAGDAYDVFNFGSSSNSYDKTLETLISDIQRTAEEEDFDDDDLDEGRKDNDALFPDNPRLPEIKKLADKIVSMVKAEAAKGELGYIRTMEEIRYQQEDDFERTPEWNKAKGIRSDFDDYGSGTNESRNVDDLYDTTVHTMKRLAKKYKAGDKSVVPHLKKLTDLKKKLEQEKIKKASNIGRGQEIEEAGPGFKHDCAAKVVHEKYGAGTCIPEKHTLVKEGKKYVVTHYDVLFESGKTVQDIPVSELEIKTQTEHWHKGYKKKKKD